ncbi:four helix bundle protein [Mucilaginibacter conchicola]|uniref:Four helix bundle protein n=1 Tax=Mucilaginibacter conchicola TaxID=2303333 RepID=A0A372NTD6_9SPHI|nr:four helix bundle protein [Mucilaginibacter conchicola]RFZ92244.1 four helix bundle protein [Mucilaginibacter conchicola]
MSEKPYDIKQRCYQFSKEIVLFISNAKYDRIYFSVFDQLLRSGTSIGANIIEAKAGSSTKDFRNFYNIALKSGNETKYWICLIRDTILSDEKEKLNKLLTEADEISKIIARIIINLK